MEARRVSGYNWVSVVSLFCYVFLLLTFLINGKSEKVFSKFMLLMTVMIVWVGGSVAMRAELWPGVNFWHHVSVGGMVLAAGVYFLFIVDFLEDKHTKHAWIWCLILFALFVFDCVTCFFIPEPVHTHDAAGGAQFVYNYTWHFYLLLVFRGNIFPIIRGFHLVIHRFITSNSLVANFLITMSCCNMFSRNSFRELYQYKLSSSFPCVTQITIYYCMSCCPRTCEEIKDNAIIAIVHLD